MPTRATKSRLAAGSRHATQKCGPSSTKRWATPPDRPRDASTMFGMVDALLDDPTEAKRRLALLAKDIASSDPEQARPPVCLVG